MSNGSTSASIVSRAWVKERSVAKAKSVVKAKYDCLNCIGICCSVYDRVPVELIDIKRLAKHFRISNEAATRRFTKMKMGERVLRRKRDPLLGETCIFHDLERRVCGIYEARPDICGVWPIHGDGSCVYYNLLEFQREEQDDPNVIPLIQITSLSSQRAR
jgi:Fe-S-cluster containining protein